MWKILDTVKDFVVYDADKEFYAKIFPDSVDRKDLMRLRRMRLQDLSAIDKIESKNYNFPWSEQIFKDCLKAANYSCWICEEMDVIVGYSIVSMAVGEAHIMNICVDPDVQKQGVGAKLLENMIDRARKKAETIFLEVRPSNEAAISLYKKRGFNEIGVRKGYYPAVDGVREDAVMLALDLATLFTEAATDAPEIDQVSVDASIDQVSVDES
ncbi:MAG: ribosomal protein S18-alanine N-acetyltransferase [Methylococcales symbiont of Iophon sp. n. MRB-2018]|nr:MAG: ribosomal protein S18-alanine N-acetyltransferase [Methylococcales symbiont of Iophon sp. n. MRB-2018]KAF3979122.1 MAG: ribosomal protein S18-alanine N-acetyltransferase [Methylococcales symbiont of Iophon sp. n. MRB-2018]